MDADVSDIMCSLYEGLRQTEPPKTTTRFENIGNQESQGTSSVDEEGNDDAEVGDDEEDLEVIDGAIQIGVRSGGSPKQAHGAKSLSGTWEKIIPIRNLGLL